MRTLRDCCLVLLGFCGALAAFGLLPPARRPCVARAARVHGPDLRPSRN